MNYSNVQLSRFASSNSFFGFKSYFKKAFDSKSFDKIFVLKGGPGTGKSTILKKCAEAGLEAEAFCEVISCSSDPTSLDGVILQSKTAKVGILDGTAPHERDAVIPGAIDVLINLGDCWDEEALTNDRKEILDLNTRKTKEYQCAYTELDISNKYWSNIKAEISKQLDRSNLKYACEVISKTLSPSSKEARSTRLLSSFSKEGYSHTDGKISQNCPFSITGELIPASIFLTEIHRLTDCFDTEFLSPLDPYVYEGFANNNGNSVSIIQSGEPLLCADDFFKEKAWTSEFCVNNARAMEYHTNKAKEHLISASKYHFELEKIYTSKMNFEKLNIITENIKNNVKKTLTKDAT